MVDITAWPETPACVVATWQNPRETVRLTLPVELDPAQVVTLGAVGPGWMELTDDPAAPRLPLRILVQTRKRIVFPGTGVIRRFAAAHHDEVLIRATGAPGRRLITVAALDCLEHAMREPTLRPAHLFHADGWPRWRGHAE